jgi:hypothetical protein
MTVLLPLLLFMIFGMVDFSLAFSAHTKLRNAVAEGAYWAAQNPGDENGIKAQVVLAAEGLDPPLDPNRITVTPCIVVNADEYEAEIALSYDYPVLFGFFGAGSQIELSNSTTIPQFGDCR